jgi:hypothetical protein
MSYCYNKARVCVLSAFPLSRPPIFLSFFFFFLSPFLPSFVFLSPFLPLNFGFFLFMRSNQGIVMAGGWLCPFSRARFVKKNIIRVLMFFAYFRICCLTMLPFEFVPFFAFLSSIRWMLHNIAYSCILYQVCMSYFSI